METAVDELDLGALLPSVGSIVGFLEFLLIAAVLAGPLLTLGFGLLYWFKPPSEANYGLGYRCWWGMSSLEAWRFTQRLAGMIFTILGGVMTVAAIVICCIIGQMELMDRANWACACLGGELVLIGLACLAVNIVLLCKFDRNGYRREDNDD